MPRTKTEPLKAGDRVTLTFVCPHRGGAAETPPRPDGEPAYLRESVAGPAPDAASQVVLSNDPDALKRLMEAPAWGGPVCTDPPGEPRWEVEGVYAESEKDPALSDAYQPPDLIVVPRDVAVCPGCGNVGMAVQRNERAQIVAATVQVR